jgi:3-hydroxybutyryl-CoA dehydrogenase
MDMLPINKILVCGAGTMGAGIAQTAIEAGFTTFLFDSDGAALQKAHQRIDGFLGRAVEKGRLRETDKEAALGLLSLCDYYRTVEAEIVIEAIVEERTAKIELFRDLAGVFGEQTIFATNTSSLSVSGIATAIPNPTRVLGMHFFNPAPLMNLIELVGTVHLDPKVMEATALLCRRLGKTPVMVQDTPGFIVNRVARHFYLEAFRIAEDHIAGMEAIDRLMEAAGFRMGPFALTDLIGQDVNFAVTESLYTAFHQEPRFRPSRLQEEKIQAGFLGRKAGKGFYDYRVADQ